MKITNTPQSMTNGTSQTTGTSKKGTASSELQKYKNSQAASGASTVEISENAKLMQKAIDVASSAKATDPQRLADLKAKIQAGSYQVDAGDLADKMIEEHFRSDFGKNRF